MGVVFSVLRRIRSEDGGRVCSLWDGEGTGRAKAWSSLWPVGKEVMVLWQSRLPNGVFRAAGDASQTPLSVLLSLCTGLI